MSSAEPVLPAAESKSADTPPAEARAGGAWALLVSELTVLFRRRRTWALLLALAAIPVLIAVAVRLSSQEPTPGRGPPFLDQVTQNGLFVAFTGLIVSIPLFLPLTVGVVAGDTIAGEASLGTLRYLLVAPAGRVWLLVVKYVGAAVFALAATLTVVTAGVLSGLALFPVGPLTLLSGDTISLGESFLRALLIAGYVTVSLLGLSMIGLFFSTLTVVPVGAMAATIVLSVVAQVLDSLPQLDWLHPWLFSHYWLDFADLLRQPVDLSSFGANALLQGGYLLVFGALAYGRFVTKDILS
ncbi:ABC transporter permease [Cryobacterium sp. PAMC25264]|uniref:ABC transporter permease n=1 Tax=Cryobacterium sp. PAMC25264 TaxID=2861288 RepID=UPI001C63A1B3|nr:ABC transporter permease [Cryobacterium sp. PAMC25264]QYF73367.1 ABC transporter permease [Cryobacterium sp. PAMC25264]